DIGASHRLRLGDLGGDPLLQLLDLDDEAVVLAAADLLHRVAGDHVEADLAALDGGDGGGDLDLHAERRGAAVGHLYADADRVLAGVAVLQDQPQAGLLDVADKLGRGVDTQLLAEEVDGPRLFDGQLPG